MKNLFSFHLVSYEFLRRDGDCEENDDDTENSKETRGNVENGIENPNFIEGLGLYRLKLLQTLDTIGGFGKCIS